MLDYKYIQQLMEKYWECQTSLEEEAILKAFFAQEDVPVELLPYRQLFLYEHDEAKADRLSDDFDERITSIIEREEPVQAQRITITQRLRPLYRAAAVVAILITLGTATQKALEPNDAPYPTSEQPAATMTDGQPVAVSDSLGTDSLPASQPQSQLIVK